MKAPLATFGLLLPLALSAEVRRSAESSPVDAAHQFLTTHFQLGDGDFRTLAKREPVARTLGTVDGREVATFGIIRVGAPPTFYLDQLRDIVSFKRTGAAVLQIGAFSNPARIDDVAGLSLDDRDLESLRRCRPGDCDVQLSADALQRFQHEMHWNNPDSKLAAERIMAHVLVDLVDRYRERGDSALMTYADSNRPLSLASEFRAMVASRPAILGRFPNLYQHLRDFPSRPAENIEDIVYWSKEKLGPAVIISVTHLAIARVIGGPEGAYAAASKQIYGSHYFDSSLGITVLLDVSSDNDPGVLLAYVNRSRLDALGGFFGGLKRTIVRSRTRSAMSQSLVEARDLVEHRYRLRRASVR